MTGCPMRCVWCDTAYAFDGGTDLTVEQILEEVGHYPCRLVEITGGEPLAQSPTRELLSALADASYSVLLETGGGVSIEGCDRRVIIIYDVKCPDSGELESNRWENLDLLKQGMDEIKFVLASRDDYLWALKFLKQRSLAERFPVLFAPAHGMLAPAELASWILEDGAPVRLQIQLHRVLWGAEARGV
jgi:7-carboxy-7-deazaguanine synthase